MKTKWYRFMLVVVAIVTTMMMVTACGDSGNTGDQEQDKVKVGISYQEDINQDEHGEDLQAYIDAVTESGGEPVLLDLVTDEDSAEEALSNVDCLILTGGEDVDPSYYNEEPDANLEDVNKDRDVSDMAMLEEAIDEDMPVLATCRGLQVLNIYQGGSLYQDLPTQFESADPSIVHRDPKLVDFTYHDIDITEESKLAEIAGDTTLNVNSWHHQGVKEVGEGLTVTAKSADGMVEGLELDGASFVVAVQFHPEWHVVEGDKEFTSFFKALMKAAE